MCFVQQKSIESLQAAMQGLRLPLGVGIPLGKLNATIKTIQVNTHMITGMTFKCDRSM